jgi:hypothetical protein
MIFIKVRRIAAEAAWHSIVPGVCPERMNLPVRVRAGYVQPGGERQFLPILSMEKQKRCLTVIFRRQNEEQIALTTQTARRT